MLAMVISVFEGYGFYILPHGHITKSTSYYSPVRFFDTSMKRPSHMSMLINSNVKKSFYSDYVSERFSNDLDYRTIKSQSVRFQSPLHLGSKRRVVVDLDSQDRVKIKGKEITKSIKPEINLFAERFESLRFGLASITGYY
jgi:hypothetical protein